jgi:hypothetical protein
MVTFRKCVIAITVLTGFLTGVFCGGCADMRWHPVYTSALGGALIGVIVGHQSGHEGEGAAIGAAICAAGALLEQTDSLAKKECKQTDKEEEIVVKITNSNGSITPVKLKKKGNIYIGPKGEQYNELPTEEQLKPLYGL